MDESYGLTLSQLEQLQSFVSKDIFDFIHGTELTLPVATPKVASVPSAMSLHPTSSEFAATCVGVDPLQTCEPNPSEAELIFAFELDPLEAELGSLLLACSQQYEEHHEELESIPLSKRLRFDPPPSLSTNAKTKTKHSFAVPKSESAIAKAKESATPAKTLEDTEYCKTIWNDWCKHCSTAFEDTIAPITQLSEEQLADYLSNFIFEVRKQDGSEFPYTT